MQNYSSPMAGFYRNQMNNIAGGYNYMPQYQNTSQITPQTPLNQYPCRAVSNIKEVEALILDNPSVPHVFTNFSNNEIYVKYIDNATGSAKVIPFVPKEIQPQQEVTTSNYENIKSELETKFQEKFESLNMQIIQLNKEIVALKMGEVEDDKSKSNSNVKNGK